VGGVFNAIGDVASAVIPGAAPFIGGAEALGGLLGANNAQNQANQAAQAAGQNQSQFSNLLLGNEQTATNNYNQQYSQLLQPLISQVMGLGQTNSSQINNLASQMLQAGINPSVISNITGINADQLSQNYTNYLQNTSGTNLAQQTPGALSFYQQEQQNGINPQFAQNAQNQLQQNLQQQIADATASAAPGQNINALTKDLRNQALSQSANLAGNLAGQGQTFANQATQGLLGAAGGLDTQKAEMLANASTTGQGVNQSALGNLGTSFTAGNNILTMMQNLLGQGQNLLTSTYNPSESALSTYGNQGLQIAGQAGNIAQNTANANQTLINSLAQIPGLGSNQSQPSAPSTFGGYTDSQLTSNYGLTPSSGVFGSY
jgi:hypothetical protein